jgi:hypothetical protein
MGCFRLVPLFNTGGPQSAVPAKKKEPSMRLRGSSAFISPLSSAFIPIVLWHDVRDGAGRLGVYKVRDLFVAPSRGRQPLFCFAGIRHEAKLAC